MTTSDLSALAKAWIAYWRAPEKSEQREALSWVFEREWNLVRADPDGGWFLVLEVLRLDSSKEILEILSAGPLEDLLAQHGPYVIGRVEAEAKVNPGFAKLLGGVWKNAMSDEVWSRVQDAWDRKGWDGTPEA